MSSKLPPIPDGFTINEGRTCILPVPEGTPITVIRRDGTSETGEAGDSGVNLESVFWRWMGAGYTEHAADIVAWRLVEPTLDAPSILDMAAKHMRDRAATYDKPEGERSMAATVQAFNTITARTGDRALSESEGWLLMQVLKDVRDRQRASPHRDSLEDCTAYSALKAEARLREGA